MQTRNTVLVEGAGGVKSHRGAVKREAESIGKGAPSASGLSNINIRSRQIFRGRQDKDEGRSRDGHGLVEHQQPKRKVRRSEENKAVVSKGDEKVGEAAVASQHRFKKKKKTVGFADSVDEGDDYQTAVSFNNNKKKKVGFADSFDEGDDEALAAVIFDLVGGGATAAATVETDFDKTALMALMELGDEHEHGHEHDHDHGLGLGPRLGLGLGLELGTVSCSAPTSPEWHLQLDARFEAGPVHISKWPTPELLFGDAA